MVAHVIEAMVSGGGIIVMVRQITTPHAGSRDGQKVGIRANDRKKHIL
jgi:hypothetical protein